jgi:hypothetical protein
MTTQNTETILFKNLMTGEYRLEIRTQLSTRVWQSQTDGRYYTKGIIGWYDITDTISRYKF